MENIVDDFKCKICFQVLSDPVIHNPCRQVFCAECLNTLLCQCSNSPCPNCRQAIYPEDLFLSESLESSIKSTTITCKCLQLIPCSSANLHFDSCPELKKSHQIKTLKPNQKIVNRWTFACPACEIKNLDRAGLVSHFSSSHKNFRGVCPICASMPWGDASFISSNLAGHLKTRHKMDYDTLTVSFKQDFTLDDDEILRKVLEDSMKTC